MFVEPLNCFWESSFKLTICPSLWPRPCARFSVTRGSLQVPRPQLIKLRYPGPRLSTRISIQLSPAISSQRRSTRPTITGQSHRFGFCTFECVHINARRRSDEQGRYSGRLNFHRFLRARLCVSILDGRRDCRSQTRVPMSAKKSRDDRICILKIGFAVDQNEANQSSPSRGSTGDVGSGPVERALEIARVSVSRYGTP